MFLLSSYMHSVVTFMQNKHGFRPYSCTTINISHACLHEALESNKYVNACAHMIRVCLCGRAGRGVEQTAGKPDCGGGGEAERTVQINRRGDLALPPTAPVPQ